KRVHSFIFTITHYCWCEPFKVKSLFLLRCIKSHFLIVENVIFKCHNTFDKALSAWAHIDTLISLSHNHTDQPTRPTIVGPHCNLPLLPLHLKQTQPNDYAG